MRHPTIFLLLLVLALSVAACRAPSPPAPSADACQKGPPGAATGASVGPATPRALLDVFARSPDLPPLSVEAVNEILDTATWGHGGLSSFHAARAAAELSPAELAKLFEAMALPPEGVIPDAWCSSHATCTKRIGSWCVVANC